MSATEFQGPCPKFRDDAEAMVHFAKMKDATTVTYAKVTLEMMTRMRWAKVNDRKPTDTGVSE